MPDQPLQPFAPPALLGQLPSIPGVSVGVVSHWIFYIVGIVWLIYTIVAIYHWLRYSHFSWVLFPAIGIHLLVSYRILLFALAGAPLL